MKNSVISFFAAAAFLFLISAFAQPAVFAQDNQAGSRPVAERLPEQGAEKGEAEKSDAKKLRAENLIGALPAEVFEKAGPPDNLYPMRGESPWADDVIFYYNSNLYLFFYSNRVWQVRADHRFEGDILGISAGMKKSKTREILGKPQHSEASEDIYFNPAGITRLEKGFPLRMRLIFNQYDEVYDIYLYRGDY